MCVRETLKRMVCWLLIVDCIKEEEEVEEEEAAEEERYVQIENDHVNIMTPGSNIYVKVRQSERD